MDEIECSFRDGLRRAVSARPPLRPIDLDEVMNRSSARRTPRWLALAASVVLVAGLAVFVWSSRSGGTMPAVPAAVPSVTATGQPSERLASSYRLRVHNDTGLALDHVRIQPRTGAAVELGSLRTGATSSLEVVSWVDDQAVVTASGNGRTYRFTLDAYRGEAEWKPGDYTYTLLINAGGRALFGFSGWGAATANPGDTEGVVRVRIRNDSNVDFTAVEVHFPDGTRVGYGPLSARTDSAYADAGKQVYSYAWVRATAAAGPVGDGRTLVYQPVDYVGEAELAPGDYTYVLDLDDHGELTLELG